MINFVQTPDFSNNPCHRRKWLKPPYWLSGVLFKMFQFQNKRLVNPFTTGVENECWLQGWNILFQCCITSFDCKMIESSKLIKITTFDQNQFMSCYLIFNLRPTYLPYFQKISAHSNSQKVENKWNKMFHPRSQRVNVGFTTRWQRTLFVHDDRIMRDSNKRHWKFVLIKSCLNSRFPNEILGVIRIS